MGLPYLQTDPMECGQVGEMTERGTGWDHQTLEELGLAITWRVPLNLIPLFCRVREGQLLCTTPPGAATASVPIRLKVGGAEVPGSWNFQYLEDPIVLGISPNCGYP